MSKESMYRIYLITKYDILAEIRESRWGIFWKFFHPLIQVLTYWFLFGIVLQKKEVSGVPYVLWMLVGMSVWFFVSPGITDGCNAISRKSELVAKTKFPFWILCVSVALRKWVDHVIVLAVTMVCLIAYGYMPTFHWLGIVYYMFCGLLFVTAVSLCTSVLNVMARDTRKCILAFMRMYLYFTPILWDFSLVDDSRIEIFVRANPVYYLVEGYRDCFFFGTGWFFDSFAGVSFFASIFVFFLLGKFIGVLFRNRMWEIG